MDTEDFAFNDGTNAEIIEDLCAVFPRVGITILSDSLIIESVYSCNLSSFVSTKLCMLGTSTSNRGVIRKFRLSYSLCRQNLP
jgi:hypothetical protein